MVSPQVQIVAGGRTFAAALTDLLPEVDLATLDDPTLLAAAEAWIRDDVPAGFGRGKMLVSRPESGNWLIAPQPEYGLTP